ncbi:MAG TPA: hypothetical protein VMM56_05955 [Planctomycetaceae bacterium]|nr:hypothetical protein [Planctomycetaceae bacterium]
MTRSPAQNRISSHSQSSGFSDIRSTCGRIHSTAKQTIEDNPLGSTLAVFGVGLAVGTLLGGLMADVGNSRREQSLSQRIQQRVSSVLSEMIPDSLERKFHG